MSIEVAEAKRFKKKKGRGFTLVKAFATLFYYLAALGFAGSALLCLIVLVVKGEQNNILTFAMLFQQMFCCFVIAFVAYHLFHIVNSCQTRETYFSENPGRRFRLMAGMLLLAFFVQAMTSIIYASMYPDGIPALNWNPINLLGFIDAETWSNALAYASSDIDLESLGEDALSENKINIMLLAASGIAWCLSYVFDYGHHIQLEQDQTL